MSDELDEVWSLYADDGGQALDTVEESLLSLSTRTDDPGTIAQLFRAMHTFKGNARLLGLTSIEQVAHLAEDLVGLVRDDGVPFDDEFQAVLLEAADILRAMMETAISTRKDPDRSTGAALCERMRAIHARSKPVTVKAAEAEFDNALVFDPAEASLADDPVYRSIFFDMVRDFLSEASATLEPGGVLSESAMGAGTLVEEAALNIGMPDWPQLIRAALDASKAGSATAAIAAIAVAYGSQSGSEPPPIGLAPGAGELGSVPAGPADVLNRIAAALMPALAVLFATDETGHSGVAEIPDIEHLCAETENQGLVCLADALRHVASGLADRTRLFPTLGELFDQLLLVRDLEPSAISPDSAALISVLGRQCAQALPTALDAVGELASRSALTERDWKAVQEELRTCYRGWQHLGIEAPATLAATLGDGVGRAEHDGISQDAVCQLLRAYVDLGRGAFASANAGEAPDAAASERLNQMVQSAFSGDLAAIMSEVSARCRLPNDIAEALNRSSASKVLEAIEAGHRLYIINADFSANDAATEAFLVWCREGQVDSITSITKEAGNRTSFDFLFSSALDAHAIEQALRTLDPQARALRLMANLSPQPEPESPNAGAAADTAQTAEGNNRLMAILEASGQALAGHSALRYEILAGRDTDLLDQLDEYVARHGSWSAARGAVRQLLEERLEKYDRLANIETHVSTLLKRIQEEAIASRSLTIAALLKRLAQLTKTAALRSGRVLSVELSGLDVLIDADLGAMIEEPATKLLETTIGALPVRAPGGSKPPHDKIALTARRTETHIYLEIEPPEASSTPAELRRIAGEANAACRSTPPAGSGQIRSGHVTIEAVTLASRAPGYRLSLPIAMAALEGMVVRSGEVCYVVPLHAIRQIVQSAQQQIVRISASNRQMLRTESDELLPVLTLEGCDEAARHDANGATGQPRQTSSQHRDDTSRLFVVAESQQRKIALAVDELVGQQSVLLRPLDGYLSAIRGVAGCALLANGSVGMVLDVSAIAA